MKKPKQEVPSQDARKDRLKAALKANMSKRKAQARARSTEAGAVPDAGPMAEQKE